MCSTYVSVFEGEEDEESKDAEDVEEEDVEAEDVDTECDGDGEGKSGTNKFTFPNISSQV